MGPLGAVCIGATLAIGLFEQAVAAPLDAAIAASNRGDCARTAKLIRPLVESGDPVAQFHLGMMYATGHCARRDLVEAYAWLTLAASRLPVGSQDRKWAEMNLKFGAAHMTAAQVSLAKRLAAAWKARHPRLAPYRGRDRRII
jgi:TPR repeat protein